MTILIAPIGLKTGHVKTWLKEVSKEADKLWLIHSGKDGKADFIKITKQLENDLKKSYSQIEIKKYQIKDAFSLGPTMEAIKEIISQEERKDNMLLRTEFILNITGGTNVMAAATMIAATFFGTKADYVLDPQIGEKKKSYVINLPVKPIAKAKVNKAQQKVLQIITESQYAIENTPKGVEEEVISGCVKRSTIFEKMKWTKSKNTTLNGITAKFKKEGWIEEEVIRPKFYVLPNGKKLPLDSMIESKGRETRVKYIEDEKTVYAPWPLNLATNDRETLFKVTQLGRLVSRDEFDFSD